MLGIDIDACRSRQKRLLNALESHSLDAIVVTQNEHVQWLAGPRYDFKFSPAVVLFADGRLALVAPNEAPDSAAADDVRTYEAQWLSTLRNDQRAASSQVVLDILREAGSAKRLGVEYSSYPVHVSSQFSAELVDIEPEIYRQRRKKDADEIAKIRMAISGTEKMYEKAREIICPGINELEVFNQLQAAAVSQFGEALTGTGNDYASGEMGGPARDRRVEDGELYILDLGPAFRGYFADNCRAIAVNGKPTDEQQEAWTHVMKVFTHLDSVVKPGKSCKELFLEVQGILKGAPIGEFPHHLGHGIGLYPHEAPHLNSNWDDTFQVGDVFTCEPGLYDARLKFGMRLENDYLITENGIENLSPFKMELA
ncbi:M24 family metallopeptidase [Bremerella alba]|uniref:Putative peptidase n=1 Tax=Bremerella alba TaxID=980252 RepID=A0A7V8V5E4_9BACT|nr:Xaa-Pro peptidase family protein [Bremerella alba]MBA2115044.1 putative peptidase [Bremerella alba]